MKKRRALAAPLTALLLLTALAPAASARANPTNGYTFPNGVKLASMVLSYMDGGKTVLVVGQSPSASVTVDPARQLASLRVFFTNIGGETVYWSQDGGTWEETTASPAGSADLLPPYCEAGGSLMIRSGGETVTIRLTP